MPYSYVMLLSWLTNFIATFKSTKVDNIRVFAINLIKCDNPMINKNHTDAFEMSKYIKKELFMINLITHCEIDGVRT